MSKSAFIYAQAKEKATLKFSCFTTKTCQHASFIANLGKEITTNTL